MKFFGPLVFILFFVGSCKNELNLNAPYKEIPSVYAILNPTDSTQTIRINKVFLGEGDANEMAKISDSINYPPGEIIVSLERYQYGQKVAASRSGTTQIIFTEAMVEALPGSFSTNQRVYQTTEKLFDEGEYQLTIRNIRTGNIFKAKANAFKKVNLDVFGPLHPTSLTYPYPPATSPNYYIDYSAEKAIRPYEVSYPVNDAQGYQLSLRFFIEEQRPGQVTTQLIDYNAGTRTLRDVQQISVFKVVQHSFFGGDIFASIGNSVSKLNNDVIGRKLGRIDYIVHSVSQEYLDYMQYARPSLSINQDKPLYSNFEESSALGIFTFRSTTSVSKHMATLYVNAFSTNPATCQYKFFNANGVVDGCK